MIGIEARVLLPLDDGVLDLCELGRLLAALEGASQVSAAARALGISYRGAWGKLVRAERLLGVSLVERVKGHGSRLTGAGTALARAGAGFERESARRLAAPAARLRAAVESLHTLAQPPLRLAASHDLLLQEVCAGADQAARVAVRFLGSEHALAALASGDADLAGFHLPEPLPPLRARPPVFRDAARFVEPVMRREQGLIVAPGNPLRVRDVTDLARTGLRFVNRQRGAGTRAWFDRLIAERGVQPSQIRGYEQEEFTHFAVAATVAAGAADAGFGLRAAALRFELDFVPVGTELYYLCGDRALANAVSVQALLRELRARARVVPGYAPISPRAKRRP